MFAVLLGLLMVGVTAGSAAATSSFANRQIMGHPGLILNPLTQEEKRYLFELSKSDLVKLGIREVSPNSISGFSFNGRYAFTINTSQGLVTGMYDGHSFEIAMVTAVSQDHVTVKVVQNGRVHYEHYSMSTVRELQNTLSNAHLERYRITTPVGAPVGAMSKGGGILPQWHFETHWWGWKLTLNEHETQELIDFMGLGVVGGGTKIGRAALITFLKRLGITIAESTLAIIAEGLIALGAYIKVVDDLGGNKGIYIEHTIVVPLIIWHN
ncbi:hypothetical protein [Thermococcus sp. 9N3]|uniref:hypothetical protein n=1 Tax=Thermococcus sp. 9N3 TaxID=163002 RepID=UPI0014321431|nr:hypothetical protein [Thermococcus sp. 9N3]NJE50019.1 hypothetical protein [Thermococcus sp. 9N3]